MGLFDNIITGLKSFENNFWGVVESELKRNEDAIVDVNTERIYGQGTDSEGEKLKNRIYPIDIYSPGYTKFKKSRGVYNGHVNLFVTGNYLGAYNLKVGGGQVAIDINPNNADLDAELQEKYSANSIKGLTDKEWKGVIDKIMPPRINREIIKIF